MAIPFVGVLVLLLSMSSLIANYAEGAEAPQCRDEACSDGKELWSAVENDELSTLKNLVQHWSGNVAVLNWKNQDGWTPLIKAASKENLDAMKLLAETPGVDLNAKTTRQETALMWAAFNGRNVALQFLLSLPGIDVNTRDGTGGTALHAAAAGGNNQALTSLLSSSSSATQNIDINAKTNHGHTAFMLAAYMGHVDLVQTFLLSSRGDLQIDARDAEDNTVLHFAAAGGHEQVVRLLSTAPGIDYNAVDYKGTTPLMLGSSRGHLDVVRFLLSLQLVDRDAKNIDGKTAGELAKTEEIRLSFTSQIY